MVRFNNKRQLQLVIAAIDEYQNGMERRRNWELLELAKKKLRRQYQKLKKKGKNTNLSEFE